MASHGTPISELTPYAYNWTIKARVIQKGEVRFFNKRPLDGDRSGKVFNIDLLDAQGGSIRAAFFNESADTFFHVICKKKCYILKGGRVKQSNRDYNPLKHRYEIVFEKDVDIKEVPDDSNIGMHLPFEFLKISNIAKKSVPCRVDLCAIVSEYEAACSVPRKDGGGELLKRDIILVDDSKASLKITLWNDFAAIEDAKFQHCPVIAFKDIVIKTYNGLLSGSMLEDGHIKFDPDWNDADVVRKWWSDGGSHETVDSLSGSLGGGRVVERCNVPKLKELTDKLGDSVQLFNLVCRTTFVQTNKRGEDVPLYYEACCDHRDIQGKSRLCSKRIGKDGICPECKKPPLKKELKYTIRGQFGDYCDSLWLTAFNEPSETILGMTAEDLKLKVVGGSEKLEHLLTGRYFREPIELTVRVRKEMYNGKPTINTACTAAKAVNLRQHGRALLNDIRQMLAVSNCV